MKKKVIRLNENDIENIVKKILRESDFNWIEETSYTEQEEFIINLIDSCDKEPHGAGFSYKKGGEWYFYQDDKNKVFYYDWDNVYEVLNTKFGLNHQEMRDLIKDVLERHYNLKGYTTEVEHKDWIADWKDIII